MTYDTYMVSEITPHLWGRHARLASNWASFPVEGTLWRVQEAGSNYAVKIGVHVIQAQADWELEVEAFGESVAS